VKWTKVTVANRMQLVANGTIDLECGSTTASLSRQEEVDFSLLTFVDGGSLLVTDASGIRNLATIDGKRVAVIPGTTTETSLNAALKKRSFTVTTVAVKDHDAGVAALDNGTRTPTPPTGSSSSAWVAPRSSRRSCRSRTTSSRTSRTRSCCDGATPASASR
jgi:hypothetical protein